jgi:hypothetical protein
MGTCVADSDAMDIAPNNAPPFAATPADSAQAWRALFHRWFVEYNPLYLLSAALVLAGCFLWSEGLARQPSVAAQLGVALVAELYALALVGGAALLTRIGLRRPAALLGLLFIVYQWDSTLHTETCAYLGAPGAWGAAIWFLLFVAKLGAVGWALRLKLARNAVTAAVIAAAGLAFGPRVLPELGGPNAGSALALWVFALFALYRPGAITTRFALDDWGRIVLRRATRAAWLMSAALVGMHVFMWWKDHDVPLAALLLATPLFFVRRVRSEARVWMITAATLVVAASVRPEAFFAVALLAAAALGLRALDPTIRAWQQPAEPEGEMESAHAPVDANPAARSPYRASPDMLGVTHRASVERVTPQITPGERARLITGAIFSLYLAAWTARWSHGPWPAHLFALDVALALAVLALVRSTRWRWPLPPLVIAYGHLVVAEDLLPMPKTSIAWGETIVAIGFALLAGSLFTSFRLRAYGRPERDDVAPS